MSSSRLIVFLVIAMCGARSGFAQTAAWKPNGQPVIHFNQVAVAKVTKDTGTGNEVLSLLIPSFKSETRTRTKTVPETRTEVRTRIKPETGDVITEEVPKVGYTQVEETYTVRVPGDEHRMSVNLNEVKAWFIDGKVVAVDELKRLLAAPQHVFLVDTTMVRD